VQGVDAVLLPSHALVDYCIKYSQDHCFSTTNDPVIHPRVKLGRRFGHSVQELSISLVCVILLAKGPLYLSELSVCMTLKVEMQIDVPKQRRHSLASVFAFVLLHERKAKHIQLDHGEVVS
jgi:hypothetical protein